MQKRRSTLVCYLLAAWTAQCRHLQSRALTQVNRSPEFVSGDDNITAGSSTTYYFSPHWGASFVGVNDPQNGDQWAPAAAPENSSAVFYMAHPGELRYIIRLQAKLQQGDAVQSVLLTGALSNSTGGRPIIAYLFGPDANQAVPQACADGTTSWEIASGLLYPEDILDDSPYLFSELPGRMTGAFNYNAEPLSVTIDTNFAREAFVAGTVNGLKPLNAAALQYSDQLDATADMLSDMGGGSSGLDAASAGGDASSAIEGTSLASSINSAAAGAPGATASAPVAAPADALTGSPLGSPLGSPMGAPVGAPAGSFLDGESSGMGSVVVGSGAAVPQPPPQALPAELAPAAAPVAAPDAAAPAAAPDAVAYGPSTFHVNLRPPAAVDTSASGVVIASLNTQEQSLHYKAYLRGLEPYMLVLNMTFWAADGASLSVGTRAKTMILSKRFGMPNGPFNPTGGLGVPRNGSTFAIASGNSPDESVQALPDNDEDEDLEISRFKQLSNALRGNRLLVHVTAIAHPEGLLEGTSQTGPASLDWPIPSW